VAHENAKKSEIKAEPRAEAIAHTRPAPLPYDLQHCLEVIQRLEASRGQASYRRERQQAMQTLGVSERSLRRLQQQYRDRGIEGLKRQPRSDEGQSKVDESWQKFILENLPQRQPRHPPDKPRPSRQTGRKPRRRPGHR
jgi:hypothetical protein